MKLLVVKIFCVSVIHLQTRLNSVVFKYHQMLLQSIFPDILKILFVHLLFVHPYRWSCSKQVNALICQFSTSASVTISSQFCGTFLFFLTSLHILVSQSAEQSCCCPNLNNLSLTECQTANSLFLPWLRHIPLALEFWCTLVLPLKWHSCRTTCSAAAAAASVVRFFPAIAPPCCSTRSVAVAPQLLCQPCGLVPCCCHCAALPLHWSASAAVVLLLSCLAAGSAAAAALPCCVDYRCLHCCFPYPCTSPPPTPSWTSSDPISYHICAYLVFCI